MSNITSAPHYFVGSGPDSAALRKNNAAGRLGPGCFTTSCSETSYAIVLLGHMAREPAVPFIGFPSAPVIVVFPQKAFQ